MARPPRLQTPGGVYHVFSRGARGTAIFHRDFDREIFLSKLSDVVEGCGWSCHAYCLMTTHYHLVLRTPQPNLAKGMHLLLSQYAQGFNRRTRGWGHVIAERYQSVPIESDEQLLQTCRYLALNPVRAGLCDDPADWPWSSYAGVIGREFPPPFLTVDWLLGFFGSNREEARRRWREFVLAGMDEPVE